MVGEVLGEVVDDEREDVVVEREFRADAGEASMERKLSAVWAGSLWPGAASGCERPCARVWPRAEALGAVRLSTEAGLGTPLLCREDWRRSLKSAPGLWLGCLKAAAAGEAAADAPCPAAFPADGGAPAGRGSENWILP